jgi:signal transduction histidine kinase
MRPRRPVLCLLIACALASLSSLLAQVPARPSASDAPAAPAPLTKLNPEYEVGSWIWSVKVADKQTCRFWRAFEIPEGAMVIEARLRITVDNAYRVFLDGREVGKGMEWRSLTEYDLAWVLKPGIHVIAVEGFNDYAEAGLVAGLRIEFADGTRLEIPTDETWKVVPDDGTEEWLTQKTVRPGWESARIVDGFMKGPWKQRPARIVQVPPLRPIQLHFWQTAWFQITLGTICSAALLFCIYLLSRLGVQNAAQEILQRERARIARDIHDDFGARLTKLVLFGELAQSDLPAGSAVRARCDQISTEGRSLLAAVDEVIWTVNSRRDTLRDFETYVCSYAESFLRTTGIRCRIEADADLPDAVFDLASRRNLFLAVKEALNNAVRHAEATEVKLGIHWRDEKVVVTVEDNGRGFDPAAINPDRNGMTNMAQRTTEMGGTCRVHSQPGAGCRIEFTAPLRHRPAARGWWKLAF